MKYEDHKYEDCSITYPNLKEKRKHIDVVSGLRVRGGGGGVGWELMIFSDRGAPL